jgi:lysophospholipase L1-like esterase
MNPRINALAAAALLVVQCASAAASADAAGATQHSSYWRERTALFRVFGQKADVVMLGDSLTDGAEWAEMFPQQDIVNRGIDGDTTHGVLARLDTVLALEPKRVFVMIGINDFADQHRAVASVFAHYRTLVARLSRAGVHVFVQSTLPCNEAKAGWKSCASLNPKIRQLNTRLATLASGNVTFVDLWPVLAGKGGLKADVTYDGVHLNGEGYRLWKGAIAPHMPPAARQAGPVR